MVIVAIGGSASVGRMYWTLLGSSPRRRSPNDLASGHCAFIHRSERRGCRSRTAGSSTGKELTPCSMAGSCRAVAVIETDDDVLRGTFASRSSAPRFLALTRAQQRTVVEMNRRMAYGCAMRPKQRASHG
jgi:hypothetical protein